MEWAKITLIIMVLVKLGIRLQQFGKEQKATVGWTQLIAVGIALVLYYYAGIMDVFK